MRAALLLAGLLAIAPGWNPASAQSDAPRAGPRVEAATPPTRPRPRDPRDRAFLDGGLPSRSTQGFTGFDAPASAGPPRAELAPRPNLSLEGPRAAARAEVPTLQPMLINPRLPGRTSAQDGAVTQRDYRMFQSPAPGARLSVPMAW